MALDVLAALGKNPEILHQDKLGVAAWGLAGAWLLGAGVNDLFVDWAHTLPRGRIKDLVDLTLAAGVSLWLIWSGEQSTASSSGMFVEAGLRVRMIRPEDLRDGSFVPAPRSGQVVASEVWPVLPSVDFTTFRAACRRRLEPAVFARVDEAYLAAADRVDAWMAERDRRQSRDLQCPLVPLAVEADLVGWLRDTQLGPVPEPAHALIVLRATQAALFLHAILLRWDPARGGPDPLAGLVGDLSPGRARGLQSLARTDHVAATALSLHLNQPTTHFGCWRCGDVAVDGSVLDGPAVHDHAVVPPPMLFIDPATDRATFVGLAAEETSCRARVVIPEHARWIIAAHLAYRRIQGGGDDDPFFVNEYEAGRSPDTLLHNRANRTCLRLNLNLPWLHGDSCRSGADVGFHARTFGWMNERGLSLVELDTRVAPPPRLLRAGVRP